jgi:spore germination cell wall hydrolase CwlJ-like protein
LRAARLYFGADPMGQKLGAMEPWAPGQEPRFEDAEVAVNPDARPATADSEANIKLAALPSQAWSPDQRGERLDVPVERADLPPLPSDPSGVSRGGQTVAPKGQVTGADQRPMTPAERLGLDEKGRAKAEKCLTEVIYFEARGEVVRGQMAVAQVVLNRAFSGKYPNTVCGVVYQNSHRHLACQFTFSCDGIPDVVREPDMWERAKVIASEMLDGKLWLPEVGKATHYHAYWVRPSWVREMTKMHKLGVHTFYRPRAWGDGADAPEWGDVSATAESTKKLVEAAKKL